MCLGLLESISSLFVFKTLFFFFLKLNSECRAHSHLHIQPWPWIFCTEYCSVSFNTADRMAFKQNTKKKKSVHMSRGILTMKQPAHPYNPRQQACEHIPLAFLKKESECKVLDGHQPTIILVPSWELFIITVLTQVYTNTFTGKQSLHSLLQ